MSFIIFFDLKIPTRVGPVISLKQSRRRMGREAILQKDEKEESLCYIHPLLFAFLFFVDITEL